MGNHLKKLGHKLTPAAQHALLESNRSRSRLSDIILGGQDGLVNVLGVLLGVAAASNNIRIVIAGGLAATFAESISMAAVAYTSNIAIRDFYYSQMEKEKREMKEVPEIEKGEIRDIFKSKGLDGELLEKVTDVIVSDERIWLETMMRDELQLQPVDKGQPLWAALIVGVAAIVGSLIPLIPFFFLNIITGIYISIALSALTLFVIGAIKARLTIGSWAKSGVQMAIIGTVSALAGYFIGALFSAPPGV